MKATSERNRNSIAAEASHLEEARRADNSEPLDAGATSKLTHQPPAAPPRLRGKTVSPIDTVTPSNAEIPDQPTKEQEKAELAAVLATETFKRSSKLSRLLSYLCDKYFAGERNGLKEYSIAVEVLGRDSEFDPQLDAAVRVDTHYLRKRLKECYAGEARDHKIQIVIPKGQYIPQFIPRPEPGVLPDTQLEDGKEEAEAHEGAVIAGERGRGHQSTYGPNWRWPALALAAVTVGAMLWVAITRPWQRSAKTENIGQGGTAGAAASHVQNGAIAAASELEAIRILAGERKGNYVDKSGRVWLADHYFTGGTTFDRGSREIVRTQDPDIYRSGREGQFAYEIPLKPGTYELHLYFAETLVSGESLRVVYLSINGATVSALDVDSDAGGANVATEKIYKDISPAKDGLLHLAFRGSPGAGFVNALEIVPGTPGKMAPIRLIMRDIPYRDHLGQIWMPDQYFLSGRRSLAKVPIEDIEETADPPLYNAHRFGNFTYSIPVVEAGKYTITLHFAETYFTSSDSFGGIGSRVFDVYCNGQTLLKDFDILKETGVVRNRRIVKVFHNIPASAQGKLNLTFVPTKNYALISAIEVKEE